jgi:hypothetical protein
MQDMKQMSVSVKLCKCKNIYIYIIWCDLVKNVDLNIFIFVWFYVAM